MHIINSPSLPYWGHIADGGLHPGSVIQIMGHIPHHCSKFELNLYGGHEMGHHAEKHSNIALQLRTKLHKRKFIVNSRHYGDWGHKEKHKDFHHLYHGSHFDIQIVVEHQHYRIMVNGHTICHYHHRVPLHEVRSLNLEGHVDVHRIEYRHSHSHTMVVPGAHVYPSAPSAPYYPSSSYPHSTTYPVAGVAAPIYPAPPPVIIQPMQPSYVPSTVVIEDHHHHSHHTNPISGIIDSVFGHHGQHHDHHHHDHHHHGHHYDHHHHKHH